MTFQFDSSLFVHLMVWMIFLSSLAFSYFIMSFSPFSLELGFNITYLIWFWMFSVQEASHVTVLSCCTFFQRWPAGGSGMSES